LSYISTAVEYGLHCLLYLVSQRQEPVVASARDLAELQGVPVEYLAKTFTKLRRAGLVVSIEGIAGGFSLAKEPERISVLDVIVAIDGKKPLFNCRNIRTGCAVFGSAAPRWASKGVCSIHAVMLEAEAGMRSVLATRSLADIANRVATKAPPSYAIDITKWLEERSATRQGAP
jgi:Rrf2 family protein